MSMLFRYFATRRTGERSVWARGSDQRRESFGGGAVSHVGIVGVTDPLGGQMEKFDVGLSQPGAIARDASKIALGLASWDCAQPAEG